MSTDYYSLLDVSRNATMDEIKMAYRKKAMQHHPDRNKDNPTESEKQFKLIKEAYETLSDPQSRSFYDRTGRKSNSPQEEQHFSSNIFNDLFSGIFNQHNHQRQNNARSPGADVQFSLNLSLNSILSGQSVTIQVPTQYTCTTCSGTGSKNKLNVTSCSQCSGRGFVINKVGFTMSQYTCPSCSGRGKIDKNPCTACSGNGHHIRNEEYTVNINAVKV